MYDFLHGLRVIELGHIVNGPLAGQILGDFGADVIKVEPLTGDIYRHAGIGRNPAMSAQWQAVNRNKRTISIDLKTPVGKDLLGQLLTTADAMIHNMRVKAVNALGFSYEQVRAIKPDIVYAFSTGYGQDGPYRDYPAFDDLIQGYSGVAASNAGIDGSPKLVPLVLADTVTGQMLAQAVMAAIYSRRETSLGCCIEVPMFEMASSMVLSQHLHGHAFRPPEAGYGYPRVMSPNRGPCKTADSFIVHGVYQRKHWVNFLQAIDRQDLLDSPMLADDRSVAENIDRLYRIMATDILPTRSSQAWRELFDSLDIPNAPVLGFADLENDPHLRAVGLFEDYEHPSEGPMRGVRLPVKVTGVDRQTDRRPPRIGQDSRAILAELGIATELIDQLVAESIVV